MSSWEASGLTDEWYTPKYIFDALDCAFDVDVAAPADGPRHVPCRTWISERSLEVPWRGFVWMNPPYGPRNGLTPWLRTFIAHGDGIALVPDRTSAPWFQDAAPWMDAVLFVNPRIQFERPDGSLGKSPGTGSALFGLGNLGRTAIKHASSLGWIAKS